MGISLVGTSKQRCEWSWPTRYDVEKHDLLRARDIDLVSFPQYMFQQRPTYCLYLAVYKIVITPLRELFTMTYCIYEYRTSLSSCILCATQSGKC